MKYIILILILISTSCFSQIGKVITLKGNIYNEITKEPISVFVVLSDSTGKRINNSKSNSQDGSYLLTGLKPGNKYSVSFADNNKNYDSYLKASNIIAMPNTDKYVELSQDYNVIPNNSGLAIPFSISPFEVGKSKLKQFSNIALDNITDLLLKNINTKFVIACFPDNNKNVEFNIELTQKRAEVLAEYFVNKGIDKSRLELKSNSQTDTNKPMPEEKAAKGRRYKGSNYLILK